MEPIDHDIRGNPIYSSLDLAIQRAPLPVFDMERMKLALEGPSTEVPKGLSRDELRAFIVARGKANEGLGG